MIPRRHLARVVGSLDETPAVVILGPRQIGKTTLARQVAAAAPGSVYLDLEDPGHAARLADPACYLARRLPDQRLWAVEIKRGAVRKTSKGFELAANDLGVADRFVVHSGDDAYPLSERATAMPLDGMMTRLAQAE